MYIEIFIYRERERDLPFTYPSTYHSAVPHAEMNKDYLQYRLDPFVIVEAVMVVDVSVGAVSCFQVLDYNKWRGFGHISIDQKARTLRVKNGEREREIFDSVWAYSSSSMRSVQGVVPEVSWMKPGSLTHEICMKNELSVGLKWVGHQNLTDSNEICGSSKRARIQNAQPLRISSLCTGRTFRLMTDSLAWRRVCRISISTDFDPDHALPGKNQNKNSTRIKMLYTS